MAVEEGAMAVYYYARVGNTDMGHVVGADDTGDNGVPSHGSALV